MNFNLSSNDLAEHLSSLRLPQAGEKKLRHPCLGDIRFFAQQLPFIQVLELSISIPANNLIISDTKPNNNAINISFQLQGSMHTHFEGISHPLNMHNNTHNLVSLRNDAYSDKHAIHANQQIEVLQLTIDKQYFMECLEGNDVWSAAMLDKIEKNIGHSASEVSAVISPRMHHLINCIKKDKEKKPMQGLLLHSRVLELLALQLEQFSNKHQFEKNNLSYDDVCKLYNLKNFIDINFLCDLSLTQLSRICCMNEFKIKKGFKQEFGTTVFGYIKILRMNHAASLLRDTSASIEEIADKVGYEHAHHFTKAFKDFTGVLPSVFRKK